MCLPALDRHGARAYKARPPARRAPMWDAFFCDLNYLASDLVAGKSLPILVAASTVPLDPNLLGTMVLLGVFLGSIVTLAQAWRPPATGRAGVLAGWAARFMNHAFGAFLSLSFLLRVSTRIYASGATLSLLPGFCVVCQYVPERPSTPFTLLVISIALFWLGLVYEIEAPPGGQTFLQPDSQGSAQLLAEGVHQSQRLLMSSGALQGPARHLSALNRNDYHRPHRKHIPDTGVVHAPGMILAPRAIVQSVWDSLRYSMLIVALAFYASANHGPVHSYGTGDEGDPMARRYMSVQFLYSQAYSVWPTLSAGMLRAYVYLRTAWLHGNALHLICENHNDARMVSLFCAWLHIVVLLYSAAWSCTQLSEQVLSVFVGDKTRLRMKFTVVILTLAYLYRWRDDWQGFNATLAVTALTIGAWVAGRA